MYKRQAAIAAMGFATIFNVQRRLLWVVAVGGIIAVCTRNFVNFELGYGPVLSLIHICTASNGHPAG